MIQLQLETIAVCNAACVFCPYPKMVRKKGVMKEELFRKIVDEAASIHRISECSFQGLGEPMLDGHIIDRIAYVRKTAPRLQTSMFSNGSRLNLEKGLALEKAGLHRLYVSINASTAEGRKDVMGLGDYDHVVAVTHELQDRCEHMKVIPKGVVGMGYFQGAEVEDFKKEWPDRNFLHLEGNWAGQMWDVKRLDKNVCGRALGQIMVLWDGRIALCCFDGEGEVIFGDLNHETIEDCYKKPEWVEYRQAHVEGRRGELKLCANCTAI